MADITRAQLAADMGVSVKTLRRLLPRVPDLQCNRVGRKITFSPADVARIRDAMRGPYAPGIAPKSRMRVVASASGRKSSSSASSAQERVRALTLKVVRSDR